MPECCYFQYHRRRRGGRRDGVYGLFCLVGPERVCTCFSQNGSCIEIYGNTNTILDLCQYEMELLSTRRDLIISRMFEMSKSKTKTKTVAFECRETKEKNRTNLNASQPHTHKSTHMLDFARFNDGTTHSNVLRNRQEHFRCKKITIKDVEQFKSKRICQPNKRTNKRSTVLFIHYDAMQRTLNIPDRFSCLKDFEFRLRTKTRFS